MVRSVIFDQRICRFFYWRHEGAYQFLPMLEWRITRYILPIEGLLKGVVLQIWKLLGMWPFRCIVKNVGIWEAIVERGPFMYLFCFSPPPTLDRTQNIRKPTWLLIEAQLRYDRGVGCNRTVFCGSACDAFLTCMRPKFALQINPPRFSRHFGILQKETRLRMSMRIGHTCFCWGSKISCN